MDHGSIRRNDPSIVQPRYGFGLPPLASMDSYIPVIVRMRIECAKCGHAEDETFEFDMPRDNSEPMEEFVPGTCPDCGAAIHMHLKRTQQVQ